MRSRIKRPRQPATDQEADRILGFGLLSHRTIIEDAVQMPRITCDLRRISSRSGQNSSGPCLTVEIGSSSGKRRFSIDSATVPVNPQSIELRETEARDVSCCERRTNSSDQSFPAIQQEESINTMALGMSGMSTISSS